MTNNLRTLQLGAPSSIEGGASPNATLSVQVMERCTNISLHDGDDGTKCTTEGAPLAFGKLIRQRETEEVSTQTWYTPEDKQPVHINVSGESTMPKADWQQSYEMVDAINKTELTEDSVFAGTLNVPIASPSKVSAFNDWAANHGGGAIVPDATVQQFEDPEVARVLAEKVGGGSIITKQQMANITSISDDWFQDNTTINNFLELKYSGVTSLGSQFNGCTNLKHIDLSNITSLTPGTRCFVNCGIIALHLNNLQQVSWISISYANQIVLVDIGTKITGGNAAGWGKQCFIIRKENPVTFSEYHNLGGCKNIFVPASSVSAYKGYTNWSDFASAISAIGGEAWQTHMRELANKYAAEYAGWSAAQIASANYADPYIDYDIFGVPRPTE